MFRTLRASHTARHDDRVKAWNSAACRVCPVVQSSPVMCITHLDVLGVSPWCPVAEEAPRLARLFCKRVPLLLHSCSWYNARHGAGACLTCAHRRAQVPVLLPDPVPGALQRAGHVPHVCGADARHGGRQLGRLVLPGRLPHALRLHLRAECAPPQSICICYCASQSQFFGYIYAQSALS